MFKKAISSVVSRQVYIMMGHAALTLLVVLSYGCGCPEGQEYKVCFIPGALPPMCDPFYGYCPNYSMYLKCCPKGVNCCDFKELQYPLFSQVPKPDLTYVNLDGLVDFGKTILEIKMPSDGDTLETKMKGRVAMIGGVCPTSKCNIQVVFLELEPVQKSLKTAKGKPVSGVYVRNANPWKGVRLSDGTIIMDAGNKLAMEATIDGDLKQALLNANAYFGGALYYNVARTTDTGTQYNNRIAITGTFANDDVEVDLAVSIWATNCQPVILPSVTCFPDIDMTGPSHVFFESHFELLGNLQSSLDLCDALLSKDYTKDCTSGAGEFGAFYCKKKPLPPSTKKAEIAKLLKFSWKDAGGYVFSNDPNVYLSYMPLFPVTLTVENKWGRTVSGTIAKAPQGPYCLKTLYTYAMNPYPQDGLIINDNWANLTWRASNSATSHDIYFGPIFEDVKEGSSEAFHDNQISTDYFVGLPESPYPEGLLPGTTYYWRIDEVNDADPNSPWVGEVWSFSIPPETAYGPEPADGAEFVDPNTCLSWSEGLRATWHTVFFGDNFDDVNNAVRGEQQMDTTYCPGPLEPEKAYYWRIDEFDAQTTHRGEVWSFTTAAAEREP